MVKYLPSHLHELEQPWNLSACLHDYEHEQIHNVFPLALLPMSIHRVLMSFHLIFSAPTKNSTFSIVAPSTSASAWIVRLVPSSNKSLREGEVISTSGL